MALVEGNTKATGYGQAPAPFVPAYGGVVDDNTAYNAVVNGAPPVMAKVTPPPVPTVIDPVNAQKLPNIWDSRYQTWRDPNTNLLAIGSDATGWDWVTEDRYAVLKPPAVPAAAPPAPVAQVSSFAGAQGNIGPTALPSGGTLADWANRGAVNKAAEKALSSVMGEDVLNVPWKDVPKFPVSAQPEDAYMFDYSGRTPMVSDQDAYYQLTHPYAYEDTEPDWKYSGYTPLPIYGPSPEGLPPGEPYASTVNAAGKATRWASEMTGAKWNTAPVADKYNVAQEVFPDWGTARLEKRPAPPPPPIPPQAQNYMDMVTELAGQGIIEPTTGENLERNIGGFYGLSLPARQEWNNSMLANTPYTPDAAAKFSATPPHWVGSGIPFDYGRAVPPAYGGYAGDEWTAQHRSPDIYLHERGHQWQDRLVGNPQGYATLSGGPMAGQSIPMPGTASPESSPSFLEAAFRALEDPNVPQGVRDAIRRGYEWGTAAGETNDPKLEMYATLAAYAAGRLAELPPYLRPYFDTLYTR